MKVIQIIPKFALAGAETMCANLCILLNKREIDVTAISLYDYHSSLTEMLEGSGVKVIYLDKKKGADFSIIRKLHKIFLDIQPDVIHTHLYVMPYAIPATRFITIKKKIHTVHNTALEEAKPSTRVLNWLFYHFNSVIPVAISVAVKETVRECYHIKNVPVIYNGIDIGKDMLEKDNRLGGERLSFIHVGRFSEQKNHEMLIDAFKIVHDKIPNSELHLIGGGELENKIREKVSNMKLSEFVYFEGIQKDVFSFLKRADVFVFPSKWEGFGISLAEAMRTGLPSVASNVGGIPELIDDGVNGLLVDVEAESIAQGMLRMADKGLRERLGRAARIKANEKFTASRMVEQYIEVYDNI